MEISRLKCQVHDFLRLHFIFKSLTNVLVRHGCWFSINHGYSLTTMTSPFQVEHEMMEINRLAQAKPRKGT